MSFEPRWSTACLDWESRIVDQRPLIPFAPLFPNQADAALSIFKSLRLKDVGGKPTIGECCRQWVFDFVSAIFGAYDPDTGNRLIQHFLLLISKKNSKSTIAAGIMVTALIRNWRESGEFYILAPTKEVADNSYGPARDMVLMDPVLSTILKPNDNKRLILHRNTGAFLKVLALDSETLSGKKTIGLLVDELWLFGKKANAANMLLEAEGGLASRPEGFVIYLSTQSDAPPAGVFAQKLEEFRDIRDGKIIVPSSLPVLYEFPEAMINSGAYQKKENWYVTNPNMGASVNENFLVKTQSEAERAGKAAVAGFLAKHLNLQIGHSQRADGWAGNDVWERGADPAVTLEYILEHCEVITVGSDGGGLDDLWGIYILGRERETLDWLGWSHSYISKEGMERRKANQTVYEEFIAAGELTLVDDLKQDISSVVGIIEEINDTGLLSGVGVDPAGIGTFVDELARIGISQEAKNLIGVRQGVSQMGAIKTIERKLADGTFRHSGQKIMKWCAGNAVVQPTPTGMRIVRDASGFGKIDPLMALFDSAALMTLNPENSRMVYEDRGIRFA